MLKKTRFCILKICFESVLVEEEAEDDEEPVETKSNLENFKYYTSLFLGTLCLVKTL
jgi:hypothetical protein